ncbi:GAF domain-containing SpoIIE family protein phosphatase [Streptomyces sp. NPDC051219]|uniref:PP2C family protein-serine/threonine phosphatase n=1 Tax=Streptomyces sp. NPDC051219 TaxID=3155283 RepID=UPI0034168320
MEHAAERIGTTLDERATCLELTRFLCPRLCDAAAVDLLDKDAAAERSASPHAPHRRAATAGQVHLLDTEVTKHGAAEAGSAAPEPAPTVSVRALDEGHPIISTAAVSDGVALAAVSVPLLAHGRIYGVLLAVRKGGTFTDHETATIHYAARLAAVHVGHARRHAEAQATALNLQRALLAEPGRPHPNLALATRYLPSGSTALVGGDWFETVRLHYGRTLLVMGDVMGHGIDAAVDMNAYRSMLRYVASTDLPPHRVLRQLDAAVSEEGVRRPATCLLVRVDPARGIAAFASAGHLPPVVFTSEGTADVLHVPVGPPLGTGLGGYELVTRDLSSAETLLMFTDGLVERRGEDIDESLSRLARLRMPAGAGVDEILDEVLARLDALHAEDDVAVLAARVRPRPGSQQAGPAG